MKTVPYLMDLVPPTPMDEFFWNIGIYSTGARIAFFAAVIAVAAVAVFFIVKETRKHRGDKK